VTPLALGGIGPGVPVRTTVSDFGPKSRRASAPKPPGGGAVGDFLTSRQGRALQRQVLRGVFGMLRKRL
jgi:hypothetical protein